MKIIKLTRTDGFRYKTDDGKLVDFSKCTLGKYKGKLFMCVYKEIYEYSQVLQKAITVMQEDYLLKVVKEIKYHDQPRFIGTGTVRVLEEIEVDEHQYSRKEAFYNMARQSKFAIEDGEVYPGYTFNEHWNGWEMPLFTKETAMKICEECSCYYEKETDAFYFNGEYGTEMVGEPCKINTPNGILDVYDFGSASWIWHEVRKSITEEQATEFYRDLCGTVYGDCNKTCQGIMTIEMIAERMEMDLERAKDFCNAMIEYGITERQGGGIVI